MKQILKKVFKVTGIVLLSLLGFIVLVLVALQFPPVQTFIAQKATTFLTKKTGGTMHIGRVHINFIDRVTLQDVVVVDPNKDTLLNAGFLQVDIGIFALLKNQVNIDKTVLKNTTFSIIQSPVDSNFNFQYIINAFASKNPVKDTTPSKPWSINVGTVELTDVHGLFDAKPSGVRVEGKISSLALKGDVLDINKKIIAVKRLKLENSDVKLTLYTKGDSMVSKTVDTIKQSLTSNFFLPDIGWKISANKITFNNNSFEMDEDNTKPAAGGLDPLHLHISGLSFGMETISYIGEEIKGIIRNFAVQERSGIQVKQLRTAVMLNPHEMSLTDLTLETSRSKLEGNAKITYTDFGDFLKLKKGSVVSTKLKGYIGLSDIAWIIPSLTEEGIIAQGEPARADLDWDIQGDISNIQAPKVKLSVGKTLVVNTSFRVKGLPDWKRATLDMDVSQATLTYNDLTKYLKGVKLPAGLKELGKVNVTGHFKGKVSDLTADSLVITSNGNIVLKGNIKAKGLPNIDTTHFDMVISELNLEPSLVFKVAEIEPVDQVTRLGKINYQGTYQGTIYDMALKGVFVTDAGTIEEDLHASFQHDYKNATYGGRILATEVNLAQILADTSMGRVTLEANISGSGFAMADLDDTVRVIVQKAEYLNYVYKNVNVNGTLYKKEFNGDASIDDPNVKLDFKGLVSFNDTLPRFQFSAMVDTLSLKNLHLTSSTMDLHTKIDADFSGISLDKFQGQAMITEMLYSNDSLTYYMDSIVADAKLEDGANKLITLSSPVVNARLEGEYHIAQIANSVTEVINRYFPISAEIDSAPKKDTMLDQAFDLQITASHPLNLIRMFVPAMNRLDTASVNMAFNNRQNIFDVDVVVPGIVYDSIAIDTITLGVAAGSAGLAINAYIDSASMGTQLNIPYLYYKSILANKELNMTLAIGDNDSVDRLYLAARLARGTESEFVFNLKDSLEIASQKWDVKPGNEVSFGGGRLKVKDMVWTQGQRELAINSDPVDKPSPPLKVTFKDFDLAEISKLASYGDHTLEGILNGEFVLHDPMGKFAFNADLKIDTVVIDSNSLGTVLAKIEPLTSGDAIGVDVSLKGANNDVNAKGNIANDFKSIDVAVNMPKLELKAAQPFVGTFIDSSNGSVSANLKIKGPLSSPDINGTIGTHGLSTLVKMFHARYAIEDNTIALSDKDVKINKLKLTDEQNRPAFVNGIITHDHFSNINMDLTFKTDGFRFMNSTEKDNELYYGTVGLAVNANIYGPITLPIIDASVITLPETKFAIAPLGMESDVAQEDFIIFHNPRLEGNVDTLVMAAQEYKVKHSGVDLTLEFELTKGAQIEVVIDPLTGDKLLCHGDANLGVRIPPNGSPEVTGTLTIDSGYYSFTYQTFLKKKFELQRGSRIDFSGDPLTARLNVTAVYEANTTTYELIANQSSSLSSEELSQSHRRAKVDVLLNIGGQISAPELSFDIRLPENQSSTLTSMVARQLSLIKQDETEMNKQVFGLLLFGSFIADQSSGGGSVDLAGTGENAALRGVSSVSGLINNQLNKLAGKVNGLEVDLNVDSYLGKAGTEATGLNNNMVTEAQLAVSQKLFNDRVTIRVGGNVGVENAQGSQGGNGLSNLAGDFTIEYKITANGKYRVKVFQTSSYDALVQNNEYKTGVGFTFRESFRSIEQLKKDRKEAKKAKQQPVKAPATPTTITPAPVDQTPNQ